MKSETIIARRRKPDGKLVRVFPDGREELLPDPGPLPHLSEEEINAAALSDPDNPPLTPERLKRLKRVTQEEFATRFRIPLGTLRDWEQGKTQPDQAARAYLTVIAHNPKAVTDALESRRR
jgi:putative transcriptional regulator